MGLYLKQQQENSHLQTQLAEDLQKRLRRPNGHMAATIEPLPDELSISRAWAAIFIVGGVVALLLAFIMHQNPRVIHGPGTGVLAGIGLASLVAGAILRSLHHQKR
jgi:hypothetical protein